MAEHYAKRLIEDVAYHVDWTWEDAIEKYGRSRATLYNTLKRQGKDDLITRLNENSGIADLTPYLTRILELLSLDNQVTWGVLSRVLGKKPETMKQYLYQRGHAETVAQIDRNSKGV